MPTTFGASTRCLWYTHDADIGSCGATAAGPLGGPVTLQQADGTFSPVGGLLARRLDPSQVAVGVLEASESVVAGVTEHTGEGPVLVAA